MKLDFKKYDHITFHEDVLINKKIKAYLIIFDYQSIMTNDSDNVKIERFIEWERIFLRDEFYEIIPSIIYRRKKLEEKVRRDNMSLIHKMACKLSDVLKSVINDKTKNK